VARREEAGALSLGQATALKLGDGGGSNTFVPNGKVQVDPRLPLEEASAVKLSVNAMAQRTARLCDDAAAAAALSSSLEWGYLKVMRERCLNRKDSFLK
jgi:hypothetical protein